MIPAHEMLDAKENLESCETTMASYIIYEVNRMKLILQHLACDSPCFPSLIGLHLHHTVVKSNTVYMVVLVGSDFCTGGTCPNDFFEPIDKDIRTQ